MEEGPSNGDQIWYAPDTTIFDPQKDDILTFYGVPLTGGDGGAGSVGLAVGLAFPSDIIASVVSNSFAFYALVNDSVGLLRTYYDTFLPFIAYVFRGDGNSFAASYDGANMEVVNLTDVLWKIATGSDVNQIVNTDGNTITLTGTQFVRNFDLDFSSTNDLDGKFGPLGLGIGGGFESVGRSIEDDVGDFGMLFNYPSPLATILGGIGGVASNIIKATPAVGMLVRVLDTVNTADAASWVAGAAIRLYKGMNWADGSDPLIIDLDGDGIETISADQARVFFDVDEDLFAEITGWINPDEGFLVRDINDNDRIDDASEMFGRAGAPGYAELGAFDLVENGGDGDGRITAADAIWDELLIWRDRNVNAEADAGELVGLDEMGIVAIDLTTQALDITTPQGAQLLATGEIEFADGQTRRMYEAIFESFQTYTRYNGEDGAAAWQEDFVFDSRGYGSVTNLAIASANDIAFGQLVEDVANSMDEVDYLQLIQQAGQSPGFMGRNA